MRSGRCWRRAGGSSTSPVPCSRQEGSEQIDAFLQSGRCDALAASPPSPGSSCRCPTIGETPPSPAFSSVAADGFPGPDREKLRPSRRSPSDDLVAAARLPAPPQPASRARRRGVAGPAAWIPGLWLAGVATGQPAQASEGELTSFDLGRDEDGVFLSYSPSISSSARVPRRRSPSRCRSSSSPKSRSSATAGTGATAGSRMRRQGLEDRLSAADVDLPRHHRRRPDPELPDPRGGHRRDQPQRALEGRRGGPARRRPPLPRIRLPARRQPVAEADADRHLGQPRLAAVGQAHAAHQLMNVDSRSGAGGPEPAPLPPRSRWAWIVSTLAALGRRPRPRLPARHRDQQPGSLRASLRLAVLGQRGAGEHPRRRHRRRRRAHALARLARPLRQPPAAQAGGDLRPRRHPARRADLHRVLPVRLALGQDLVRRQASKARSTPASTSAAARSTRSSAISRPRRGWRQSASARTRPRPSRSPLERLREQLSWRARSRHRRQCRPDPDHDRRHDHAGPDARSAHPAAAAAARGAGPARRQPGRRPRRGGLGLGRGDGGSGLRRDGAGCAPWR